MNEILKINYETEQPTLSARDLHEALGIEERFSKWFERMIGYGFDEKEDYTPYQMVHPQNHQEISDYTLSVDMAKEICMIQRTDKGKQCRQYFIELEKAWNTPEQIFARALKMADRQIEALKTEKHILTQRVEKDRPKVLFAEAVSASHTSILVGELAKILKQNGIDIGGTRFFDWLRNNGYLIKRKGTDWNMPTQRSMELELFEIKESTHIDGNGCNITTKTPKVTGKGQQYFINKFMSGEETT